MSEFENDKEKGSDKEKGRLVSPNDMMEAGKRIVLDGREPETKRDWILLFNFVGANIVKGLEEPVSLLIGKLYSAPLTEDEIRQIANYQMRLKDKKEIKNLFKQN